MLLLKLCHLFYVLLQFINSIGSYFTLTRVFLTSVYLMVFYRSLSDNKSPQKSRTLLRILADLNNAVVWISAARPLISSSLCTATQRQSRPGNNGYEEVFRISKTSSPYQMFLCHIQDTRWSGWKSYLLFPLKSFILHYKIDVWYWNLEVLSTIAT